MTMRSADTVLVLLLFVTVSVSGFELPGLDARIGYVYTFNEYEGQGSEGEPLDVYAGLAFPVQFSSAPFFFGVALDVSSREYLVTSDGPVVPTQIETGAAAGVGVGRAVGMIIGVPFGLTFTVADVVSASLGASPSLFVRLPVRSIEGDTSRMAAYFRSRIFFPEAMFSVVYDYSSRWSFGFAARCLVPAFNRWIEDDLPFTDQMMIGGHLTIRRRF